jgi:hypothetical protein
MVGIPNDVGADQAWDNFFEQLQPFGVEIDIRHRKSFAMTPPEQVNWYSECRCFSLDNPFPRA